MADFKKCAFCGKSFYVWTAAERWMWTGKGGAMYCSEECKRAARFSEWERRRREKELSETKAK